MNRFFIIAFTLLTISSTSLLSFAADSTTQSSTPLVVDRHLKVRGNPSTNEYAALQLFRDMQNGQGDPARFFHEVMQSAGLAGDSFSVAVNELTQTVDIRFFFRNPPSDPQRVADDVVNALIEYFTASANDAEHKSDQARDQLYANQMEIEECQNQLESIETQLRKTTGAVDVSPASLRERMDSLQTQKESATIELAAKLARSDALAEQIAKLSSQIQSKIESDPIAAELSKVVDACQKELDREQKAPAGYSASAVDQAAASLAQAKAKLLERQEAAANAAGGDVVSSWNRELMTLAVDIAELKARSHALDDRLTRYANADKSLNECDGLVAEIAELQKLTPALREKFTAADTERGTNWLTIDVIKPTSAPTTKPAE